MLTNIGYAKKWCCWMHIKNGSYKIDVFLFLKHFISLAITDEPSSCTLQSLRVEEDGVDNVEEWRMKPKVWEWLMCLKKFRWLYYNLTSVVRVALSIYSNGCYHQGSVWTEMQVQGENPGWQASEEGQKLNIKQVLSLSFTCDK